MDADMPASVDRPAWLAPLRRRKAPWLRQILCRRGDHLFEAPALDQVFEARLFAVGAVAVIDEDVHDSGRGRDDLARLQQHAAVLRETAVAGEAAEQHAEVNAFRHRLAGPDPDRGKADIVRVFEDADSPAAVDGDVELARQ